MWSPCFLLLLLPPVVLRRPTWSRIEPRWPDSNRMESFCYLRSVLRAKKPDLASTWWKVLESTLILLYFAIIWGIIITKSDGTCFVGRYLRLAMWHGDILFTKCWAGRHFEHTWKILQGSEMQLQPFRMKVRKSVRWSINSISTHGVTISLLVTIVSDPQGRFCMDAIRRDFIPQGSGQCQNQRCMRLIAPNTYGSTMVNIWITLGLPGTTFRQPGFDFQVR